MGIIERKKTLGSAAENGVGRMIVNKHTFFFGPIHFGLLHLFLLEIMKFRPRKNIVMTCVSGSLPKTIRIGRSILFSESAPKIYGM